MGAGAGYRRSRFVAGAAPAIALATVAAAGVAPAGAAPQSAAKGTVKIGVGEMLTGGSAYYGNAVLKGIQLAVSQINGKGGVLGKKIVLTVKDNASNSTQAVNIVRAFGQDKSIPAIIPPTYQPNFEAACAVINQIGIPAISAQSNQAPKSQNPKGWCFTATSPLVSQTQDAIKHIMQKKDVKSFALIYDQQNEYQATFDKIAASYIKKIGGKVAADVAVNEGATDYGPQITELVSKRADVVIPNLTTEDAARFIQQAHARGVRSIFFSPDTNLTNERIYDLSRGAAAGLITASNQSAGDTPSFARFLKAFKKRYKAVDDPSYSGYGYDAMFILAQAMKDAKTTTDRAKIKSALSKIGRKKQFCVSICYKNNGQGAFLTPKLYYVELTKSGWVKAKGL